MKNTNCTKCNKKINPRTKSGKCLSCSHSGQNLGTKHSKERITKQKKGMSSSQKFQTYLSKLRIHGTRYKHGRCITEEGRKKYLADKQKEWVEKNRQYKYYLNGRRRVLRLNAEGFHTYEEWESLKELLGNICTCCKQSEPGITLTEDHIVPLSRGGTDNIDNIQPLCRSCNSKKHTKTIKY